jgi:hypothetical protein
MRLRQLAQIAAIAAIAVGIAACGSSSKKPSKPNTTPSESSATSKAEAKTALDRWLSLTPKLNTAFSTYGSTEPAHAKVHDTLAVRRDAYNLRLAVYDFDIAVRKIKFPATMQTKVNSLLDTTKTMVAALDGVSQSSKTPDIDRNIRKANTQLRPLEERAQAINLELHHLAGRPLQTSQGAGPEVSRVAAGLLKDPSKSGAKGQLDATCAARLMVKKLSKADLDTVAAGVIPKSGRLSNEIGASLLACQAAAGG